MGRGKGDEVTDEADGKCQVAIQLGCDLGSRARWGKGSPHRSPLRANPWRDGESAGKDRDTAVSGYYHSLLRSFNTGRRGAARWRRVTFLVRLLSKSKPRTRLCQQGTNKLHIKQQKYTFQGEVGQEKPDFVCTAEYFSLTSSYENKKLLKTDLLLN